MANADDRMKINGYSTADIGLPPEQVRWIEIAEITIAATPSEARRFAAFLLAAADDMDRMGPSYSHEHLADRQPGFDASPHVTMINSELEI
jgi:hypothetical protein